MPRREKRLCEHKCEFLAIYAIVASSSLPPFAKTIATKRKLGFSSLHYLGRKLQISSSIMGEKTRPFSNMRNLSRAMGILRLYVCTDLRWSTVESTSWSEWLNVESLEKATTAKH
ncbi:hypothetical protein ZIOFF_033563 [Zingiber officinale]|uniref:Uncharacterized protein n=1 Tax=Zingiber officinale TaxID=94328 RepID=A0A8J5LCL9_ZINOF|nr:hypothetical protein ZIOFF_033563 [Zingiber officinale]